MAINVRLLFVLGMTWGSVASQIILPSSAAASEIRLRASQWQQLVDADRADQARQTKPPSEAEIKEVQLRVSQLRAIDADTVEGQAQLMNVIEDPGTLAYIRTATFGYLAQAEIKQLKQIDATAAAGQAELLQVLKDSDTPSFIRQGVLEHLSQAKVQSAAVQQVVLPLIRTDIEKNLCQSAIYALQNLGVPADDAVPVLIPMLDDHRNCSLRGCSGGEISFAAADVLGNYGAAAKDAIPRLAWEIDPANNRPFDPSAAQSALGRIAPDQFPFFVEGDAAITPLIKQLSSEIHGRRMRAAERLLDLREHAGPAAAALETALHDENQDVRAAAAAAILAMRPHEGAGDVFTQLARSDDQNDRAKLIRWLCNYKLNFDDGDILRGFLKDPDPNLRSTAASQLAKTDRHTAEAFEAMVALYNLGGQHNQVAALRAIGDFPPELVSTAKDLVASAATQEGSIGNLAKSIQRRKLSAGTDVIPAK